MKLVLSTLFLAALLLAPASASAAPVPPSNACVILVGDALGEDPNSWPSINRRQVGRLLAGNCLSKSPYDVSEDESKDWQDPICLDITGSANSYLNKISSENETLLPERNQLVAQLRERFQQEWGSALDRKSVV